MGGILAPVFEELFYRLLAINSMVLSGISVFHAFMWAGIYFGLIHISQVRNNKWWGGSAINDASLIGFIFGFVAMYYGIIMTVILHALANTSQYIGKSKKES